MIVLGGRQLSVAAEYQLPSDQAIDWSANTTDGVGVVGGIASDSYTQSGSAIPASPASDQTATIQAAINAASAGQYVLLAAGTHRVDSTLSLKNGVELRGEGVDTTFIESHAASRCISIGSESDYDFSYPTSDNVVTAGNTRGSTEVTIADTSPFSVGQIIQLRASNPATVSSTEPIVANNGTSFNIRRQLARVTAKTGTTLTFVPSLHDDWSGSTVTVNVAQVTHVGSGLRGFTLTGMEGPTGAVVFVSQLRSGWLYDVRLINDGGNRILHTFNCLQIEVRRSRFDMTELDLTPNHAGILIEGTTNGLFVDNILTNAFPCIQFWGGGNYGTVVAYNLADFQADIYDHNTHDKYVLVEGNIAASTKLDGYYGSNSRFTYLRNWFYGIGDGIEEGETETYSVALNRFSRKIYLLGNRLRADYSLGNPNIGNSSFVGYAAPMGAASTLSTRTSDTAGTITAPSGHGVTTGATIDVWWAIDHTTHATSHIRRGVTVGTVSGTAIPISGGLGDVLPSEGAAIYVPTSNDSLRDWWGQLNASGSTVTGTLTTRSTDTTGTITLNGTGTALSDSWPTYLRWSGGSRTAATGTVSGNTVPIVDDANNSGDVLPAQGTTITLWLGPAGYQEYDVDVVASSVFKGNYIEEEEGVPAVESLGGDTLPASLLYDEKPEWWGSLPWPFDPVGTTPSPEDIPAGYRYINGEDPPDGEDPPAPAPAAVSAPSSLLRFFQ